MTSSQNYTIVINTHSSSLEQAPLHSFTAHGAVGKVLTCKRSAWVTRHAEDVQISESPQEEALFRVKFERQACVIYPGTAEVSLALGQSRFPSLYSTCRLRPGNEIRLGNVALKLRELEGLPQSVAHSVHAGNLHAQGLEDDQVARTKTVSSVDGQACRICLSEDGLLVQPCACTGSVGTVHLTCLGQWLNSKLTIERHRDTFTLKWRKFNCELCHEAYPDTLIVNEEVHNLVHIPKAANKFLVLERTSIDKVLHVVPLRNKKQVLLGRGLTADVVLNDPSVAQCHAVLHASKSGVFLEDRGSEFGSSLVLRQPLSVRVKDSVALQSGCTVMSVHVKKKRSFARWLCGGSK